MQCVWLKRDPRVDDHAPLAEAARRVPLRALSVYEPDQLAARELDASHGVFRRLSRRKDGSARAGTESMTEPTLAAPGRIVRESDEARSAARGVRARHGSRKPATWGRARRSA